MWSNCLLDLGMDFLVGNGYVFDLERGGLRQVVLCPRLIMR